MAQHPLARRHCPIDNPYNKVRQIDDHRIVVRADVFADAESFDGDRRTYQAMVDWNPQQGNIHGPGGLDAEAPAIAVMVCKNAG